MLLLYRLGENRFSVSDFPLLYSLYRWHVCFCIIHPSASYTAEETLLFPGTYWSNNCYAGLKFPHSSYFLFYMFSKVYLKTKKMTDISQTQAEFKAKSRRNPLWIPRAIPHNSKCRYGERGAADAVPQLPERCLSRKAGIVRCCLRNLF